MRDDTRVHSIPFLSHDLHGPQSWRARIKKAVADDRERSRQGTNLGRQEHLIDHDGVMELRDSNVHHSACLDSLTHATVGLGHRNAEIARVLNPLCDVSWADCLGAVIDNMWEFGNGYFEVVRNDAGEIKGIYHLPSKDTWVSVEDGPNVFHYEIASKGDALSTRLNGLRFARFGEKDELAERLQVPEERRGLISEVIHIPFNRGRRSPHYGYPSWISATSAMESEHCLTQYEFDFFLNGGVPEAIYNIIGKKMDPDDWDALKKQLEQHVGLRNRRKVMLLNLHDPEMRAQLDKLTLDGQSTGENEQLSNKNSLKVVTAHRTPPLLAGITIPGRLGAANEFVNALMVFQLLAVGPAQKLISQVLACTLGNPALNGGLGLTEDQFLGVGEGDPEPDPTDPLGVRMRPKDTKGNGFNTLVDEIDLGAMETTSRMRMSPAEAGARGRDLGAGLAERGSDIEAGRGR